MITIAHVAGAVPVAPAVAVVMLAVGGLMLRGRRSAWLPAVGAAAALTGFALLVSWTRLERAWLTPRSAPDALLMPALVSAIAAAVVAWRGRQSRWVAVAVAGFAGWWLTRISSATGTEAVDHWRVLFGVMALTWVAWRGAAGQAWRGAASGLALWGGLAVAGSALTASALVLAAAMVGLRVATVPSVLPAVLIGAAELSGGRLLRGRVGAVDIACLSALAAPWLAGWVEPRLKRIGRFGPAMAACAGAAVAVGAVWFLRRALFT